MSSEKTSRSSKLHVAPTPAPPGDHRKRRRNRTTQSCLNCHASKRMCDRKRPACQRCTTLGLTGLCVYEVDDPSQRNTSSDEKALLRSRVAELEGVIREMKNKPHPRWAQKPPGSQDQDPQSGDDTALPSISIESCSSEDHGNKATSDDAFSLNAKNAQPKTPSIQLTPVPTSSEASISEGPLTPQDPHFLSAFNLPSPPHSSSSSSPAHSHRVLPCVVGNDSYPTSSPVFNVDNLLASACLEPTGFEEGIYGHMLDHILQTDQANATRTCSRDVCSSQDNSNCGCINHAMVYNALLELSVRLRKAVESLGRIPDHHTRTLGSDCQLYRKICDLDNLTSSTLGNTTSPADRRAPGDSCFPPLSAEFIPSTISPNSLTNIQQWEAAVIRPSMSRGSNDDSFMSWDGAPRENWPHAVRP